MQSTAIFAGAFLLERKNSEQIPSILDAGVRLCRTDFLFVIAAPSGRRSSVVRLVFQ
jgi:hypothetical protein